VAWLSGYDVGLWLADFPCPAPNLCLTGDHFVGKLSAMGQPTHLSLPPASANEYLVNSYNYIDYGVETIKQQTRAAYGCVVAGQSPSALA